MLTPLLVANHDVVIGGGEVGLRLLVRDLKARGHNPVVATPGARPLFGEHDESLIPDTVPGGALALRGLASRCDLVHVFSNRGALMAILARTAKPVIVHALVPTPEPYDGVVAPFASALVANSRATARRFNPNEVRVIYNGVPHPRPGGAPLDLRTGRCTVAIVGNFSPRKGQMDALPALEQVMAARDDVDVVFAGHVVGPIALALAERAAASNGRIRLLGFVPDIADHFGQFALVLVPSRSEGFGRVAVEALRAGVPVLATRVEGLQEALQDHVDPWLPGSRDEWPARILRELESPTCGPDALRAAARRFDPDRYTDDVVACYRDVVRRAGVTAAGGN